MTPNNTIPADSDPLRTAAPLRGTAVRSTVEGSPAVSWPAVFAGAIGAAALSLILLVAGTGLGLASVSAWSSQGASGTTVGVGTVVWILFVAAVASGLGGYLAGRLRTRWTDVHGDEVYFRDTAHGFLSWAVATLLTAALLTSTIGSIVGTGVQAGGAALGAAGTAATAAVAGGATAMAGADGKAGGTGSSVMGYFTDALFRPNTATAAAPASSAASDATGGTTASTTSTGTSPQPMAPAGTANASEVPTIFARSIANGALSPDDMRYVAQLVAQRTGLGQADAEKRVTDTYAKATQALQDAQTKAREAADTARKAAAYTALWLFVSLLLGAFTASLMATFGGRQRDQ